MRILMRRIDYNRILSLLDTQIDRKKTSSVKIVIKEHRTHIQLWILVVVIVKPVALGGLVVLVAFCCI